MGWGVDVTDVTVVTVAQKGSFQCSGGGRGVTLFGRAMVEMSAGKQSSDAPRKSRRRKFACREFGRQAGGGPFWESHGRNEGW